MILNKGVLKSTMTHFTYVIPTFPNNHQVHDFRKCWKVYWKVYFILFPGWEQIQFIFTQTCRHGCYFIYLFGYAVVIVTTKKQFWKYLYRNQRVYFIRFPSREQTKSIFTKTFRHVPCFFILFVFFFRLYSWLANFVLLKFAFFSICSLPPSCRLIKSTLPNNV